MIRAPDRAGRHRPSCGLRGLRGRAAAAPTFPALTGRVVDDAHVLSTQTQADLTAKLAALEQKNGDQLVVVTLPSLQGDEIEDYGYQLGRAWGIGQKGKDNGVLFIVAPNEKKVRIEVGYGLEGVMTDALSSVILQRTVLPKFRDGDVEGGVVAGTNAIVSQLGLDPAQAQANAQAAEQAPGQRRPNPRFRSSSSSSSSSSFAPAVRSAARRRPLGAALPVHGRR